MTSGLALSFGIFAIALIELADIAFTKAKHAKTLRVHVLGLILGMVLMLCLGIVLATFIEMMTR